MALYRRPLSSHILFSLSPLLSVPDLPESHDILLSRLTPQTPCSTNDSSPHIPLASNINFLSHEADGEHAGAGSRR